MNEVPLATPTASGTLCEIPLHVADSIDGAGVMIGVVSVVSSSSGGPAGGGGSTGPGSTIIGGSIGSTGPGGGGSTGGITGPGSGYGYSTSSPSLVYSNSSEP